MLAAATGKRMLFYCAFGERSAMAVQATQDAGLTSACHIQGGLDAWKKAAGAAGAIAVPTWQRNTAARLTLYWGFRFVWTLAEQRPSVETPKHRNTETPTQSVQLFNWKHPVLRRNERPWQSPYHRDARRWAERNRSARTGARSEQGRRQSIQGEGGRAQPQKRRDETAALAKEEEHVLRCLGAAVIMQWNHLAADVQRELFHHATSMGELRHVPELKGQIALFLKKHKDGDRNERQRP